MVDVTEDNVCITREQPGRCEGYYSQIIAATPSSIPILAHNIVSPEAMYEAFRRMRSMLRYMPIACSRMQSVGAELHIIPKRRGSSSLPEWKHLWTDDCEKERKEFDARNRGTGGLYCSCGEENLIQNVDEKEDRYFGRDICVHELAHTILSFGTTKCNMYTYL